MSPYFFHIIINQKKGVVHMNDIGITEVNYVIDYQKDKIVAVPDFVAAFDTSKDVTPEIIQADEKSCEFLFTPVSNVSTGFSDSIITVKTSSGCVLTADSNLTVLTPVGYVRLCDLSLGSRVMTNGCNPRTAFVVVDEVISIDRKNDREKVYMCRVKNESPNFVANGFVVGC